MVMFVDVQGMSPPVFVGTKRNLSAYSGRIAGDPPEPEGRGEGQLDGCGRIGVGIST